MWQKEVRDYLKSKLTFRQRQLLTWVLADLYDGSPVHEDYPGFVSACEELGEIEIPDLYYDNDSGELSESCPENPGEGEEWGHVDYSTAKQLLFGQAAKYI